MIVGHQALSIRECKTLVKWLQMRCSRTNQAIPLEENNLALEDRIIKTLYFWRSRYGGDKPMPRWKLERALRVERSELQEVAAKMEEAGLIKFVRLTRGNDGSPLPWRPSEGYRLTKTFCCRFRQKEQKVGEFDLTEP